MCYWKYRKCYSIIKFTRHLNVINFSLFQLWTIFLNSAFCLCSSWHRRKVWNKLQARTSKCFKAAFNVFNLALSSLLLRWIFGNGDLTLSQWIGNGLLTNILLPSTRCLIPWAAVCKWVLCTFEINTQSTATSCHTSLNDISALLDKKWIWFSIASLKNIEVRIFANEQIVYIPIHEHSWPSQHWEFFFSFKAFEDFLLV